jgi:IS4 transposase
VTSCTYSECRLRTDRQTVECRLLCGEIQSFNERFYCSVVWVKCQGKQTGRAQNKEIRFDFSMSLLMERDDEGTQVEILWKWRKRALHILQKII